MHAWDVSIDEAIRLQQQLRDRIQKTNAIELGAIKTIAGVDASYSEHGRGVAVLFSFPQLELLQQAVVFREAHFPYVPGLLSFREAPLVVEAVEKLTVRPDLLLVDGQGYAHPRRIGLASHLGLYLDLPSVGCAKSRLTGRYTEPGPEPGDRSPLTDHGEVIGVVLRTKRRTNPLFVSIGHKVDLETAVEVVLRCLRGYRMPEPTRIADKLTHAPVGDEPPA